MQEYNLVRWFLWCFFNSPQTISGDSRVFNDRFLSARLDWVTLGAL